MSQNDTAFTRKELQNIVERARMLSETVGTNHLWVRVFVNLELAASTVDAFIARSEENACKESEKNAS